MNGLRIIPRKSSYVKSSVLDVQTYVQVIPRGFRKTVITEEMLGYKKADKETKLEEKNL